MLTSIADRQLSTATAATEDSGEQRSALLGSLRSLWAGAVCENHRLNLLELLPGNISFVMSWDQRDPSLTLPAATTGRSRITGTNSHALLGSSKGVCAAKGRMRQDPVN